MHACFSFLCFWSFCDVKLGTMVAAYYDSSNIPPRVLFDERDLFGPHAVPLA